MKSEYMVVNASCPVDLISVNENRPRITAALVVIVSLIYIWLKVWIIPALLLIDFLLRAFKYERYSLLGRAAKLITEKFHIKGKSTDIAPKRFAAKLGAVILSIVLVLYFSGYISASVYLTIILIIFAALESVFGLCVGCKIYQWVHLTRGSNK